MTKLREYVKNEKEVKIVSEVREEYVKSYRDFLIKEGKIEEGKIIVDIPCGTGDMARDIADKIKVERFVLIDINETMVQSAKNNIANTLCFTADAGDIGEKIDFKVDTILCLNGFHQYFDRKEDFLKSCAKILKKSGRLVFDISTRGLYDEYTRKFFQYQKEEAINLSKKQGVTAQLPAWPDKKTLEKYHSMVLESGLSLIDTIEFTTVKTVDQILFDAVTIPGRSRPWIPGLNYSQRKDILTTSIDSAVKRLGKHPIEHNRIFFICEKTN